MKMRAALLFSFLFCCLISFSQNSYQLEWAGAMGSNSFSEILALTTDANGFVYSAGHYMDTTDMDLGLGNTPGPASPTDVYLFVSKSDPAGNLVWYKAFPVGYMQIEFTEIKVTSSGDPVLVGTFNGGSFDADPGPGTTTLTSNGSVDIFVIKLDNLGNLLWAHSFGGPDIDTPSTLALDASENIYVGGVFSNTMDIDPGPGTTLITSDPSGYSGFQFVLNSSGALLWHSEFLSPSDTGSAAPKDIRINSLGEVIIAFNGFSGDVDFDPGPGVHILSSTTVSPALLKLDPTGGFIWVKTTGNNYGIVHERMTIDANDQIIIGGNTYGTMDFDMNVGTQIGGGAFEYSYVAKYDANGNYLWHSVTPFNNNLSIKGIEADGNNDIYVAEVLQETLDANPGAGSTIVNNYDKDILLRKFSSNGDFISVYAPTAPGYQEIRALTVTPAGNPIIAGYFGNSFDADPASSQYILTSQSGYDAFALKLNPTDPVYNDTYVSACDSMMWINGVTYYNNTNDQQVIYPNAAANGNDSIVTLTLTVNQTAYTSFALTVCDSYNWNGTPYFTSGTDIQVFPSASGCDSIVQMELTVLNSSTSTTTVAACQFYDWNGNTYNSSGTYYWTTTNAVGCDSTAILELTIAPSSSSTTTISNCGPYNWNGNTYNSSGTYQWSGISASGCDSTATLVLTINNSSTSSQNVTACGSYNWNGSNYTASGTYIWTGLNANGCDSTATLNLIIKQASTSTTAITACGSYNWNGTTYTSSGVYSWTGVNAAGCDSVATLNLTINNASSQTVTTTSCGPYNWNGDTYSTSGTYTWTGTNVAGCDSVVTLNLTVNQTSYSSGFVTSCGPYTWNGNTYNTSGNYNWIGTNAAGCDSVVNLSLTVLNPASSVTQITTCGPYAWSGSTYNTSGTYTWTGVAANGCDSVATLQLTVNQPTSSVANVVNCGSYFWNGTSYSTSGTYTWTGTNVAGCDSTATLNLIVNQPSSSTITLTSCGSYNWNGTNYTSSGIYQWTGTNAAGCDSVATLDLTIVSPVTSTTQVTTCGPYSWNGSTYNASGNYTWTGTAANGCDSVATLQLTISQPSTTTETVTACDSYVWNGMSLNASGTYYWTGVNAAGCDSIVTLNLTLNQPTQGFEMITSCGSYTWPANGISYSMSGIYSTTLTNAAGCDSVATLELDIISVDISTSVTDFMMTSNAVGATYQWLDCDNNFAPISGQTSASFTASANGNYAVEVTQNGCTDTSSCIAITTIGVDDLKAAVIEMYPNPTTGKFTVVYPENTLEKIQIISTTGQLISTYEVEDETFLELEITEPTGIYHVIFIGTDGQFRTEKLVVL